MVDYFSARRTLGAIVLLLLPTLAFAHSGPPLDKYGCHADRVRGDYHCHLREMRGMVFESRGDMLDAIESGELPKPTQKSGLGTLFGEDDPEPEPQDKEPGLLDRVVDGDDDEEEEPKAGVPAPAPVPAQRTVEERLKILKGLHEMGLITEEEYAARRVEILKDL